MYIVETDSGKFYTGITTNVERRFSEHSKPKGSKAAKFFRTDPAKKVVYRELCADRSSASQRESTIKKMPKRDKVLLVLTVMAQR